MNSVATNNSACNTIVPEWGKGEEVTCRLDARLDICRMFLALSLFIVGCAVVPATLSLLLKYYTGPSPD